MTPRIISIIPALALLLLSAFNLHAQQSGLTAETWDSLTQNKSVLTLQKEGISVGAPDSVAVTGAEIPTIANAGTGIRLRGTVTPLATDKYTFWVSGVDNVMLWISTDASRFNKQLVAYSLKPTNVGEWDNHPEQRSIPIDLTGGQTYYIEAQVMDSQGGGYVGVAWRGQNGRYCLAANGATATQSSTKWGKVASGAIDGDTGGVWGKHATTLTNNVANSWWQVDFGQDRSVNQIVLHNLSNNQNRLSNFRISVLDVNDAVLASDDFFTTSGNVGDNMTWDLPSVVNGARKVKIELLGLNLAGNGYLALAEVEAYGMGLVQGQVNFREVIPSTYLSTIQADADDTNDNNLSDAWELQKGLTSSSLPGALLEYGDPDNDGLFNYEEQQLDSDPLAKDALVDGLTRSIWMDINGSSVANFTGASGFYSYPNAVTHVSGVDEVRGHKISGVRFRGVVIAPATGEYRFWISSKGNSELWLSNGSVLDPSNDNPLTNRYGKQLLATSGAYGTAEDDFDYSPGQHTRAVQLTQGQEYYIEVLHANQNNTGHVSVAWQAPGGERVIIPATSFLSNTPEDGDADDDNLPDAWETANSLDPADNGGTNSNDGEYGDADGDTLTNLQEYQYGTDPQSTDTDGDGISDKDEISLYGSDPTVSNNLAPVVITLPLLNQYSGATGAWSSDGNGALVASDRRGGIAYSFTVTEAGVHEVILGAGAISPYPWWTQPLPIELTIDGGSKPFARETLYSKNSQTETMRALTPWLAVGTHTLTIYHNNYQTSRRIRIDSLEIKRLGGTDLNSDGVPDWIAGEIALNNTFTRVSTQSRTSPVSIEGITQQLSTTGLTVLAPGSSQPSDVPVTASINGSFFADVPLSVDGAVTLEASWLAGASTQSESITWIATNLFDAFADDTLHIRAGDALLLDAWNGAQADAQPFTVTLDGTLLEDENQNTSHTSGQPFAASFTTAGSYTLVASHGGQTATVTLEVHAADFGPSHAVQTFQPRDWTPPTLGGGAVVEADDHLVLTETTANPGVDPRSFTVKAEEPVNRHVIARIPEGADGAPSAILARGTVHVFEVAAVDQTGDARVVTRYSDGTWLMSSTMVAVNLPAGVYVQLKIKNQGSLFVSGSNIMELRAGDFDANGIATIYYEAPASTAPPKLCHIIKLFVES